MSYFRDACRHLSLRIQTDPAEPGLRECQAGANWATLAHFTASDDPALLALPTGAGKTGLMMLLAFGLRAQRVLVVTPAVELRRQTFDRFSTLADLALAGAVPAGLTRPKAHQQIGRITSQAGWEKLRPFDVAWQHRTRSARVWTRASPQLPRISSISCSSTKPIMRGL